MLRRLIAAVCFLRPLLTRATLPRNDKFSSRFTLHSSLKKRAAFTLAEVLITLGIIGVVAALTIPGLLVKYQKQVTAKRLEQTYSILYQAVMHAQADYGDMGNWDVNQNFLSPSAPDSNQSNGRELAKEFAQTYITPYLKYTNKPDIVNLKSKGYSSYKTKDGREYMKNASSYYIIELSNGTTLFVNYNGNNGKLTYPVIFVDVNGKNNPNILGRDFFMFSVDSVNAMKLTPCGYEKDREELLELCSKNSSGNLYDNLNCTGLIAKDGWEIKDDYPW